MIILDNVSYPPHKNSSSSELSLKPAVWTELWCFSLTEETLTIWVWFIKFKRKWRNQTACSCWRRLNWSQNSERGSSFRCGGSEWLSGDRVCVRPESSDRLWGLFLPAVSLPIDQCEGCSYKYLTGTSTESVLFILLILKHIS